MRGMLYYVREKVMSKKVLAPRMRNRRGVLSAHMKDSIKESLLRALGETNNITAACEEAGITRETFYTWVRSGFIEEHELKESYAIFQDRLRGEIVTRATIGVPQPMVVNGRVVRDQNGAPILTHRASERLLEALARRHLDEWKDDRVIAERGERIPIEFSIEFDSRDLLPDEWELLKGIASAIEDRKKGVVDANV